MDAVEILAALKARLLATKAVFMTVPRKVLQDAADTIERQAKEIAKHRGHIGDLQGRLWSVKGTRDQARKDRDEFERLYNDNFVAARNETIMLRDCQEKCDAALAENKKLNGVIGGLSAQSQDEIDRLTVTANNNAAAHAKACEDLAQARAEVERLKARLDIIPVATGAPRCKLCGVLISTDPAKTVTGRHNQFCSTCCAR